MDIVIVEDDGLSRQLLTHLLKRWQHQVVAFTDGDEAYQHLLRAKGMQLAILDWMLPGMEGIDICRRLREAGKHHYLMMLTFRHQRTDCITALQAGADDFVPKPFHPDELQARLSVAERILRLENDLAVQNECLQQHSLHLEALVEQRAKEMMHAERMASIGQLSAGIAHELNNPLAYVSGNVQILERLMARMQTCFTGCNHCVELLKEVPDMLHGIRDGIQRVAHIINGLRSFSRNTTLVRNDVDLAGCIDQALVLCTNRIKHGVTVEKSVPTGLPSITADATLLVQVLVNLITNALDAMAEMTQQVLGIRVWTSERQLHCAVEDTGHGLLPELRERIFEPFFTTKPEGQGTGLGLAIAQRIMREHGGQLTAEDRPGGGTRFSLVLPIERKEHA